MDEGRRSKYFYRPMIGDDDSCDDACVTADKAEVSIRCRRSSKRDAVEPKFIGWRSSRLGLRTGSQPWRVE